MSNARDKANIPALNFSSTGIDDNATSTAITIDSSENVGINTSSPAVTLDTSTTSDTVARFMSSGSTGVVQVGNNTSSVGTSSRIHFIHNSVDGARIDSVSTEDFASAANRTANLQFKLRVNGNVNEIMRLQGSNVGIGTSSPASELHVKSSDNRAQISIENDVEQGAIRMEGINPVDGNDNLHITASTSTSDRAIYFTTSDSSPNGKIILDSNGNVGIATTSIYNDSQHGKLAIAGKSGTAAGILIFQDTSNNEDGMIFADDGNLYIVADRDNTATSSSIRFRVDGSSEKMRIDSSGNVGIGTTSPANTLHLFSSAPTINIQDGGTHGTNSSPTILFKDSSSIQGFIDFTSGGDFRFYQSKANNLSFGTQDTERMKIESDGKIRMDSATLVVDATNNRVGVGTSVPTQKFEVYNPSGTAMTASIGSSGSGLFVNSQGRSSTMTALSFNTSAGAVGSITCSTTTSYNTTSDYRLKENVNYDFDATSRLKQLKPARFNFIADADTTVDGFLAHEVSDIVPEAITGEKDAVDEDGNPKYQGIDQSKLVPLLVKTIQELEARITTLEANNP